MRPINKEDGAHTIDGIGERILNIPLRDYLDWDMKYEGCWHDNGFVNEWKRDNPDSIFHSVHIQTENFTAVSDDVNKVIDYDG